MNRIRQIAITLLLLVPALRLAAQEQTDTVHTFRFHPGRDMFYVPAFGNGAELARLEACVDAYRSEIVSGRIPVYVDGYCNSAKSEAKNLAVAKVRSNRVKSELIVHNGIREEHFITCNHSGQGDFVTVRIVAPKKESPTAIAPDVKEKEAEVVTEATAPTQTEATVETPGREVAVTEVCAETCETPAEETTVAEVPSETASDYGRLAVCANLLRWATLTPDLGVEWRINRNVGVLVNGSWTSWSQDDKNRRYALWEISPEVRYYIGKEKRGYIGVMYKAGAFNYKFGETGKRGDIMGGGITGGYQMKLNNALALDFSLGLGCIHADYDKYTVIDGVRVRQGKENKNWWGPVSAGVTLVWTLF